MAKADATTHVTAPAAGVGLAQDVFAAATRRKLRERGEDGVTAVHATPDSGGPSHGAAAAASATLKLALGAATHVTRSASPGDGGAGSATVSSAAKAGKAATAARASGPPGMRAGDAQPFGWRRQE